MKKHMDELKRVNSELRRNLYRQNQYQKAILNNAYVFFEVDLTADTFISAAGQSEDGSEADFFESLGIPEFQKYSDFLHYWADNLILEGKEKFLETFGREQLIQSYENGQPECVLELRTLDKLGRCRFFRFVMLIGRNDSDNEMIALALAKDITEAKEDRRLFQMALQEANAANIAHQTFLDNISHDVRTPLNSIIGFTELIRNDHTDEEKLMRYLENIRISSRQLLKIVTETLELTHIESGKAMLNRGECSLDELINAVIERVSPDARNKNIQLSCNTDDINEFDVYTDSIRLEEVLYQILDNAIKYTPKGGAVSLICSEAADSPEGFGTYTFEIHDTGCGIEEELIQSVFKPFSRIENSTMSGVFGSGLGLAVVKNIVDMMNGTIKAESSPGVGSTFTVILTFPLQALQRHVHARTDRLADPDFMKGMSILLVEDNPINMEIEKAMLEHCGCIVDTALNGREATEKVIGLKDRIYDLILMDIQMPVLNGYDAARAIRAIDDPEKSGIPIIAVSANAFEDDREKSLRSGMNAHFPKPIDMEELRHLIARILHISEEK